MYTWSFVQVDIELDVVGLAERHVDGLLLRHAHMRLPGRKVRLLLLLWHVPLTRVVARKSGSLLLRHPVGHLNRGLLRADLDAVFLKVL